MSETTTAASTLLPADDRVWRNVDRLMYWVRIAKSNFDIARFRESLPGGSELGDLVMAPPREGDRGRYSIICSWSEFGDDIEFNIVFRTEALEHAPDEREPFAEDFVGWLGQFSTMPVVKSHLHAGLTFALEARDSTFPLALSTALPSGAELNGVSIRLGDNPHGVLTIQIIRGQSDWFAEIVSERDTTFSDFNPSTDIDASLIVLRDFLAERAS